MLSLSCTVVNIFDPTQSVLAKDVDLDVHIQFDCSTSKRFLDIHPAHLMVATYNEFCG